MELWTPAEIPGAIFLDPDDPTTYTVVTGVSEIKDKNTGVAFAIQATTTKQPAVISNGLNGRTTFRWDGTDDNMTHALSITSNDSTIFGVVNRRSGGSSYQLVITANGPYVQFKNNLAGLVDSTTYWGSATSAWFSSGVTLGTDFQMICSIRTITPSESQKLYTDGALSATKTSFDTYNDSADRRYLGADSETVGLWSGELALLVIVPTVAVDTDVRQRLEGWAAAICGLQANLAADHPYKSAAPTINKVSGIVTVNGSPAARTVAVFLRSDFTLIGTTTSDETTGAFELNSSLLPDTANALLVTAIDSSGTYNAVSVDYITSVA